MLTRIALGFALFGLLAIAAPEDYTREHVRFLALQLDQWNKEFPQEFYTALMQPGVDSAKLSPAAKASAGELGESIHKLALLATSKDPLADAEFRSQVDKALAAAKDVNQTIAGQRFPANLQSDWEQIRSTLNNLARVYKLEQLAFLEPAAGSGRRGASPAAQTPSPAIAPGSGLTGYIVDVACAKNGKGMWTNTTCIERCVRDGEKVVLVTEEGKIYQISNQEKITPETYGRLVTVVGKTHGESITVDSFKL